MQTLNLLELFRTEVGHTKKSLGQHFLVNPHIFKEITAHLALAKGDRVIEIGPGCGLLTQHLIETGADVTAIEIDDKLADFLRRYLFIFPNFSIVHSDILKVDLSDIAGDAPIKVCGNLPYYMSVKILEHCISHIDAMDTIVFMFQKEVADRINANPSTKEYGSLSVFTHYHFTMKKLRDIPGGAFWPKANVRSTVMAFTPKRERLLPQNREDGFFAFVRTSFTQKRKTLKNNLRGMAGLEDALAEMGLSPSVRAEALSVEDFVRLYERLAD